MVAQEKSITYGTETVWAGLLY